MRYVMIFSLIFLFAGCATVKKQQIKKDNKNIIVQQQQELIARYCDLPDVPFQVQLKNLVVCPENYDQVQISYTTNLSQDDVTIFYEQQMERLGWQFDAQLKVEDHFLYFSKPLKFCCIVIQQGSFMVYMGSKDR